MQKLDISSITDYKFELAYQMLKASSVKKNAPPENGGVEDRSSSQSSISIEDHAYLRNIAIEKMSSRSKRRLSFWNNDNEGFRLRSATSLNHLPVNYADLVLDYNTKVATPQKKTNKRPKGTCIVCGLQQRKCCALCGVAVCYKRHMSNGGNCWKTLHSTNIIGGSNGNDSDGNESVREGSSQSY